ncbi:MAG: restriction endonuclease subunit S [Butyrivibrio sp.]|jgi:type I restriction enzyme S subunit|nr:restriction endonuclease subunit S [Butyrivibrio sp.]
MREMKDSGVEWIGEIPKEWSCIRMKNCIKERDCGVWGEEEKNDSKDIVCVRIADFDYSTMQIKNSENYKYTLRNYDQNVISRLLLQKGDILIEKSGGGDKTPVGRTVIFNLNFPCLYANFIERIRVKEDFDNRYVQYIFVIFYSNKYVLNYIKQTTGIQNLDITAMLNNEMVVCPPHKLQVMIADYLEKKCSQIDNIIEKEQRIIERLKAYRISMVTEAVTKGLNPDVKLSDCKIGWIDKIPAHWKTYRIANLYKEVSENGNEDLPILTVSINTGVSDRELSDEESDRVFVRSEDKSKYKRVQPGDLTYNMMRAWQGAFGAVRVEGMVSPAYVVARPFAEIDSRYAEYLLRTPIATEEMHRYSHGIADFRLRLYWPEFRNIRICFPPLEEQKQIADFIDEKSAKIDELIARREVLISKLTAYKKSLIYEVVTGKREVTK